MKILILGGDGFCGWPTVLHLSAQGHDIMIVDNLSRRRIDLELGVTSLTPIASLENRCSMWQHLTGHTIPHYIIDVDYEYNQLLALIEMQRPDVIIHFAEQRAAPYSMKTPDHKRYTVSNNVNATHNVLAAIVESGLDIHLVHLGTMGVYGYGTAGDVLPEGYQLIAPVTDTENIFHDDPIVRTGEPREIRYPSNPGSIYHMTKCLDAEMFAYYAKNDKLRITDLHQGIIWGTNTTETKCHQALINRFDYDGDYGTVLNRFIVQAAIGHPLTVHGTGGQTRAFIHIQNSVECIELAIANPPARGDRVKIFNQMTETHRVSSIASHIATMTNGTVDYVDNPRNEAAQNELLVENKQFLALGLTPIYLSDDRIDEELNLAITYSQRVDQSKIPCTSRWVNPQLTLLR